MTRAQDVLKWHAELEESEVESHPAFHLYRDSTALLVIDVQEKLAAAMPEKALARAVKNMETLVSVAGLYELPVIVTEQYPQGLGSTIDALAPALESGPALQKRTFSAAPVQGLRDELKTGGRRQIVVVGMETHVCVFQTVRDLVERGYFVHVVRDACVSRTKDNWKAGLALMGALGATVTTTEIVAFDLAETSEDAHFKAVSALVK